MYFIAYESFQEWRPRNRWLYPTKREAEEALAQILRESAPIYRNRYKVEDADHEPGRSILKRAGFFT